MGEAQIFEDHGQTFSRVKIKNVVFVNDLVEFRRNVASRKIITKIYFLLTWYRHYCALLRT